MHLDSAVLQCSSNVSTEIPTVPGSWTVANALGQRGSPVQFKRFYGNPHCPGLVDSRKCTWTARFSSAVQTFLRKSPLSRARGQSQMHLDSAVLQCSSNVSTEIP